MKNLLLPLLCLCCFLTASAQNSGQLLIYVQHADSINTPIIAQVYLISHNNAAGTLTEVQSIQTSIDGNGTALFENVPAGQYLVKAAVVPGTVGYNNNLPTYYGDVLLWSDASYLTVEADGFDAAVIHMITGVNPGGPGFIGGLISEGANLTDHHTEAEFSGEGDPVAGASIILTRPDGTAVAHAVSNSVGEYSFPSLAYGTYVVTINILGIAPVSTTITLSPAEPSFSGINFDVNQNGAVLAAEEAGYEAFTSVQPNPTQDVLYINLKATDGYVTLVNSRGQVVRSLNVTGQQMSLSLATLPQGTYFLTARSAKGSQSARVVKQ